MKVFYWCFLFVFSSHWALCQKQGFANVKVAPTNAIIRIDTILVQHNQTIELDTGFHTLKVWAPKRKFITKEFNVSPDTLIKLVAGLPYSKAYRAYRRSLRFHDFGRNLLRIAPPVTTIWFAVENYDSHKESREKAKNHLAAAKEAKIIVENSFWINHIEEARMTFEREKAAYDKEIEIQNEFQTEFWVGIGVGAVATYFAWKLAKRRTYPPFEEEQLLSKVNVGPSFNGKTLGFQCSIRF